MEEARRELRELRSQTDVLKASAEDAEAAAAGMEALREFEKVRKESGNG